MEGRSARRFAPAPRFAREAQLRGRSAAVQPHFPAAAAVVASVMLTTAIVFGMVGVAAGFAWDYVVKHDD